MGKIWTQINGVWNECETIMEKGINFRALKKEYRNNKTVTRFKFK